MTVANQMNTNIITQAVLAERLEFCILFRDETAGLL